MASLPPVQYSLIEVAPQRADKAKEAARLALAATKDNPRDAIEWLERQILAQRALWEADCDESRKERIAAGALAYLIKDPNFPKKKVQTLKDAISIIEKGAVV